MCHSLQPNSFRKTLHMIRVAWLATFERTTSTTYSVSDANFCDAHCRVDVCLGTMKLSSHSNIANNGTQLFISVMPLND
jgi:hypothetical protein